MRTNLAYIDDVMDREVDRRHKGAEILTEDDRKAAKKQGERSIAGFPVFDEEREKKFLDDLIASRRRAIDGFIADRKAIRESLASKGITPLAVLPSDAWDAICDQTKLFRLSPFPTRGLRIGYHYTADWMVETTQTKKTMLGGKFVAKSYSLKSGSEEEINAFAAANWHLFLEKVFGGLVALGGDSVNVILPTPPADVAKILLKCDGLSLKVAAEAGAITLDKSPAEIVKEIVAKLEYEARLKEQRDADPIVYTEQGNATAVIAQFGDFPVEKAVVDAVVASGDLIKERPTPIDYAKYSGLTPGGIYAAPTAEHIAMLQQHQILQQHPFQTQRNFQTSGITSLPFGWLTMGSTG